MINEKLEMNLLVNKLDQKIILVEIEKKVLEISYSLLDDDIYSTNDAVNELMQVVALIEVEREAVMSDIGKVLSEGKLSS